MNKRALMKIGFYGISLFLLILLINIIFFGALTSSSVLEKKIYVLGEKVRINIQEINNYKLKITTPSENFIIKDDEKAKIFEPKEIGNYNLIIEYESGESESFSFEVVNSINELADRNIIEENYSNISKFDSDNITSKINHDLNINNFKEGIEYDEIRISEFKKEIKVISSNFENKKIRVNLDEKGNSRGRWEVISKISGEEIYSELIDSDDDGNVDALEFIPSNTDYEIIYISFAEHLDENRTIISDIYPYVQALDGNWSETINNGHYVRVTFEHRLTNKNDITIFPRVISGNPKIEIYEKDGNEKIVEFSNIINEELNRVLLTNLITLQDTFDLLVLDGEIQFDYIVDPIIGPNSGNNFNNVSGIGTVNWNSPINARTANGINASASLGNGVQSVYLVASNFSFNICSDCVILGINVTIRKGEDSNRVFDNSVRIVKNGVISGDERALATAWPIALTYFSYGNNSYNWGLNWTPNDINNASFGVAISARSTQNTRSARIDFIQISVNYSDPPLISIISPLNTTYNTGIIHFNVSLNEPGSWCGFSLDNAANITMTGINTTYFNYTNYSMSQGSHNVSFSCNNTDGAMNSSSGRLYFFIDSINPAINFTNPTDNSSSFVNRRYVLFNLTSSDSGSGLKNITVRLYNASFSLINSTNSTNSPLYYNFSVNTDGVYYFNASAFDNAGNVNNTETRNITLDSINPAINFTNPTEQNGSYINRRFIQVNVTVNDSNLKNITVRLYNASFSLINSTNSTNSPLYYNFSVNTDGVYYFNASAFDNAGNVNNTETRQVRIDSINPLVNVISPINGRNYSSLPIYFNISTNENSTALYTLNNGVNNYSMSANSSSTGFNASNSSMSDGNYLVRFYVNDSAGNRNYSMSVNFTLDRNGPNIIINNPVANFEYNNSNILFNFSFNDLTEVSSAWFYFNQTNYSYTSPVNMDLNDGNYSLFVYANDSLGNINFSSINFSVNKSPNITFFSSNGSSLTGNTSVIAVNNGLYDILLGLDNLKYPLYIYGFNKSGNQTLIYSNYTNESFGSDGFAISFEGMIFNQANLTLNATQTHLYKCADWNMTSLSCNNLESWEVVSINEIGSLFNLSLSASDPGFLQLNVANSDILRDGTASEASPGTEWGARTYMSVANYTSGNMHSLVMFNLTRIPSGVIVDNATLTLYCSAETLEAGESIGVGAHMVFSSFVWNEGTGGAGGNGCTGSEYCWNNKPSAAQYNNTFDSSTIVPDGCAGKNYSFTVTSSLKYAYTNSYTNISFYLIPNGTNVGTVTNDEVRFATKEFANSAVRPKLNITYHSIPKVIIISPNASSNYSAGQIVELKVNASDVATNISSVYANITLPNGTMERYMLVNISNQIYQYNYTAPSLYGGYNVTFFVNNTDNYVNNSETTWFNIADFSPPDVNFTSPSENRSYIAFRNIIINVTANDSLSGLKNISIFLYNSTALINSTNSSSSPLYYNFSVNYDGIFYFNASACDNSNNCGYTETRNVTIDTINPLIDYESGTLPNGANTSINWIYVNVSVNETNFANITYELWNITSLVNITIFNVSTLEINWTGLVDGEYYYNVSIYDLAGNYNKTETRTLRIDTIYPLVNITYPLNGTNMNTNDIEINYTIIEINLFNCFWSDNGGTNTSLICGQNITGQTWNQGNHLIRIYANDSAGNINYSDVAFFVDSVAPLINFTFPTEQNESEFERNWIYVNVTLNETNFANITFYLFNNTNGLTLVNETTFTSQTYEINFTNLNTANITYYYNVSVFDIVGNYNKTETRTIKLIDITIPTLTLYEPQNTTYETNESLNLNFLAYDANLQSCWYHIDSGSNSTLDCSQNSTFNVSEGSHTLYLYANDSLGLIARQNVTFVANQSAINTDEYIVQRGNISVNGNTNATLQVRVDQTKSFIIINTRTAISTPNAGQVIARFVNSTTIRFDNFAGGATAVEYEVVTGPDISVRRGERTYIAGNLEFNESVSGTINNSNSFVIVQNRLNSATASQFAEGFWSGEILNSTIIRMRRAQGANAGGNYTWQLVQWTGASVQNGSFSSATADASSNLASSVNTNRSFLIFSTRVSTSTGLDDIHVGGILNSTAARFYRLSGATGTMFTEWYVISWDRLEVRRGINTVIATTVPLNVSITPILVNESKSFRFSTQNSTGTGTNHANGILTSAITNASNIRLTKGTATQSNTVSWQVMEIVERNHPNVSLLYPENWANFSVLSVDQFNYSVIDESEVVNCSLYGDWSGSFSINQTVNNPTLSLLNNFSRVDFSNDGYYIWNVECVDIYGNIGRNSTNFTFAAFLYPNKPILLNASQTINDGTGNITLYWNSSGHAYLYRVYYSDYLNSSFTLVNETNLTNYTDSSFVGNKRRFYYVSAWNPTGENASENYFGAHVYNLRHTTNSRNWIGFPTNASYLVKANDSLYEIRNATAVNMWNATIQRRVTCNTFSCPSTFSCTETNCNFNFDLIKGQGYEVDINLSAPTSLNWSLVGIVLDKRNVSLIKNTTSFAKNWVSLYANTTLRTAQNLYGNITYADAVTNWNAQTQASQGLIRNPLSIGPPFIGTNFTLEIEKGYEVSVNESINWTQI